MSIAARTILVVEENDRLAALVEKYLRREGFRTAVASTGKLGLSHLAVGPADLFLLGLQLPDMTGEDLLRKLAEKNQSTPYIVLAEHGDEKRAADLLRAGAVDYVMKDGTLLELLPIVVRRAFQQIDQVRLLAEAEASYKVLYRHFELI